MKLQSAILVGFGIGDEVYKIYKKNYYSGCFVNLLKHLLKMICSNNHNFFVFDDLTKWKVFLFISFFDQFFETIFNLLNKFKKVYKYCLNSNNFEYTK